MAWALISVGGGHSAIVAADSLARPSVLQCLTDSAGACPLDCGGTAVLSGFFRWPAQIPETRSPYLRRSETACQRAAESLMLPLGYETNHHGMRIGRSGRPATS